VQKDAEARTQEIGTLQAQLAAAEHARCLAVRDLEQSEARFNAMHKRTTERMAKVLWWSELIIVVPYIGDEV